MGDKDAFVRAARVAKGRREGRSEPLCGARGLDLEVTTSASTGETTMSVSSDGKNWYDVDEINKRCPVTDLRSKHSDEEIDEMWKDNTERTYPPFKKFTLSKESSARWKKAQDLLLQPLIDRTLEILDAQKPSAPTLNDLMNECKRDREALLGEME